MDNAASASITTVVIAVAYWASLRTAYRRGYLTARKLYNIAGESALNGFEPAPPILERREAEPTPVISMAR